MMDFLCAFAPLREAILPPMSEAVTRENVASDLEALEARILTVRDSL